MSFYDANQQFLDNARLFSDPHAEPEKYNLYRGLANLAQSLQSMEHEIRRLKEEIRLINSRI